MNPTYTEEETNGQMHYFDYQEDFMSVISHEIKTPISAAIFQSKSIIENIDTWEISQDKIKNDVLLLTMQLERTGKLLTKLFSIQHHDTQEATLLRELIYFPQFIEYEIDFFSHVHTDITFLLSINEKVSMTMIDRIQIQQVITNILENAVKYIESQDPIIAISVNKVWRNIECMIEDNGKWFEWIDLESIFEKYRRWVKWSTWLWMGLYLCKKIISLHKWSIKASQSERYGGAKITFCLPIK
jgi:two-component system sensor histidine kinase VicK